MPTRSIPWPRILAEGVAIVVSILLAFGIQAWWEGRGDIETRKTLLRGLAADFTAAEVELDRVTELYERIRRASARYLELSRSGEPPTPSMRPVVDSLLSDMYWAPTFHAPIGTLEALLSAGDLDLLKNTELVSELTAWTALVDNLTNDEEDGTMNLHEHLIPYLRSHNISTADLVWSDRIDHSALPIEPQLTDAYTLLREVELEGLVMDRWFFYDDLMGNADAVREGLLRIRQLIDAELAEAS